MIYFDILLLLVVVVVSAALMRAPSLIVFIPTPDDQYTDNSGVIEVSDECTQHYHSFWQWQWKDENGESYWIPRLEKVTHFWWCTTETCPNDGDECERPRPHQKWGIGPKIHDKSL